MFLVTSLSLPTPHIYIESSYICIMDRMMSLQQFAVLSIIRLLCLHTDIVPEEFFDSLPLPYLIVNKMKKCCQNNILSDIIPRMLICNVWLCDQNNYHEETVQEYLAALQNIRDDLLPFIMRKNGL